jgi:acetyl esterase/lipase
VDPDELRGRATELPDAVLRYADHHDGVVDVHLPRGEVGEPSVGGPPRLVVIWHGGFWKAEYDRRHTRPMAEALAAAGFVVATPEYRRVGNGGGWATTFDDVLAASSALPGLLSGLGIVTSTTTLLGHSAGGQIVLWLANEDPPKDRVVALAPVGNLRRAAEHALGGGATLELLGGTPEQVPERYDAADPATRLRQRPRCEVVVVHGSEDDAVPVASSRGLAARFPWIDYRELDGVEHLGLIDPTSRAWGSVLAAVTA